MIKKIQIKTHKIHLCVLSIVLLFVNIEAQAQCTRLNPGSIGSNQTICYNTSPTAFTNVTSPSGGSGSFTYQWQSTTVSGCGSGWSNISGATAITYQAGNLTATTCYRRFVDSSPCGSGYSNSITVAVRPVLTAGSIGSNQSICYNTSPTAFTQTGAPTGGTGSYTYQWQYTTVSGCESGWGNVSGATANTYQAGNLTQTTCYRRNVTSGSCGTVSSAAITVTVYANLTAGSVGSNQSICYNTSPAAFTQATAPTGGTGSYTYQWQNTTVSGCGSGWGNISGATANTYQASSLTQTTCYRRNVTSGSCGTVSSAAINVTVYANLTAGSVGSNQSICYNTSPSLFTQTVAPSGGTGSYTYQWQSTTVSSCGSGWGNISGATASTYQAGNLTQTTCYRRNVTSGSCGTVSSAAISVTVYANLTAGSVGSNQSICYNTSPSLFTQTVAPSGGTGSYTYQWQSTTVGGCGSGWGNISGATASTYQGGNLTQTTCYRKNVTSGSCGTVSSSSITVTVYDLPVADAGSDTTINISDSVQIGSSPIGGNTYTWTPTNGLSDPMSSNPWAKPLSNTPYKLTVENSIGCLNYDTVSITVQGTTCNNAIEVTNDTICHKHEFRFILNQPEYWFMFTATDTSCVIQLENTLFQPLSNDIEVYVYKNQCNSLTQLYYFSNNKYFFFSCNSLQINNTYYVKIVNNQTQEFNSTICLISRTIPNADVFYPCDQFCINNLIYNGDFEILGTWPHIFSTEYDEGISSPPTPLMPCEAIITNQNSVLDYGPTFLQPWWDPNNNTPNLPNGYYLIANGMAEPDAIFSYPGCVGLYSYIQKVVWGTTVNGPFTAGNIYYSRFWATNLFTIGNTNSNPPLLYLRINGVEQYCTSTITPSLYLHLDNDELWHQLCYEFVIPDPAPSSLQIEIIHGDYIFYGCDFALDDIEFGKKWEPAITITNPQYNCMGYEHTLTTSGGGTYYWSTGETTSSITVTPNTTTTYTVTVTQVNGCTASNDVVVNVAPLCECIGEVINQTIISSGNPNFAPNTLYDLQHDITIQGNVVLNDVSIRIDDVSLPINPIKITIPSNASLTLNHCHLFACDSMWQGIVIEGTGTLIINNGTLIEDAIIAVDIDNSTPTLLSVDGSVFNKNTTGIRIKDYTQSGSYPFEVTNTVFTSRNFTPVTTLLTWPIPAHTAWLFNLSEMLNQGSLNERYRVAIYGSSLTLSNQPSMIGIKLENVGTYAGGIHYEVLINGDDPNITGTTVNIFDNLYFGINATNSNLTCSNNAFQYITGTATWTDGMALRAINTSTQLPLPINRIQVNGGNNFFYDNKIAIDVLNYDVVNIEYVNIRSDQGTLEGFIGVNIKTPQCSEINVNSNTITNVSWGINFTASNAYYDPSYPNGQHIHGDFNINNNIIQADLLGNNQYISGNVILGIVVSNLLLGLNQITPDDCNELNVTYNHLYNVRNGIQMENWVNYYLDYYNELYCYGNRPVISNNYISLVDPGVGNSQFGINTVQNFNGVIKENNVQGFDNDDLAYYGIRCASNATWTNVTGHEQIVKCNNVVNTGIGIEFQGDQFPTTFLNNTMDGSQMGFVLNAGILGQQGYDPYASSNKWPTTSYTLGQQFKTYTVMGSNPVNSELFIDASDPHQNPESGGTGFNWNDQSDQNLMYKTIPMQGITHITPPNTNTTNCDVPQYKSANTSGNLLTSTGMGLNSQISWLERLVKDSVNYTVFPVQQHINDMFRVYRILEMQPALKDNSVILKNFYNTAHNGNIGALVNAENNLANGHLSQSISTLASVTPQNDIESNYIDFYNVYIHYRDSTFTVADSIILKALVDGCPARDGLAVHKARTLYSMIYRDYTLYSDICIDNNSAKMLSDAHTEKSNPANLSLQVFPNPNTGIFTISLFGSNSISESAVVSIYNILGNKMNEFNLQLRDNMGNFDAGLNNGIYFISVKDSKGNIYNSEKIIVIK
ncbi:MAG: T9SS type A sorting domain-containing protein [Bacteroidales bacterium]|nr:T9SS type A sorting domain-containing protein [Bacteroidales bacterium]